MLYAPPVTVEVPPIPDTCGWQRSTVKRKLFSTYFSYIYYYIINYCCCYCCCCCVHAVLSKCLQLSCIPVFDWLMCVWPPMTSFFHEGQRICSSWFFTSTKLVSGSNSGHWLNWSLLANWAILLAHQASFSSWLFSLRQRLTEFTRMDLSSVVQVGT